MAALLLAGATFGEDKPASATEPASPAVKSPPPCHTVTPRVYNRKVRLYDRLTGKRHHKASRKVCKKKYRKLVSKVKRRQATLDTKPRIAIPFAFSRAGIGWRSGEALRVAYCESTYNRFATNGQYAGLFQLSAAHQARMGGSVWSAYDNAYYAATVVRSDGGWGQWECKP